MLESDKAPKTTKQKGPMKKAPIKNGPMKKIIQKKGTKTHRVKGAVRVKAKEERGSKFWQVLENRSAVIQVTQKTYGTSAITLANELAAMWRSGRPIKDLQKFKLSFRE